MDGVLLMLNFAKIGYFFC